VVRSLSLGVGTGELVSLLGPSGCGKTTVLRIAAGFELPDEGSVLVDGHDMAGVPPERRELGMVAQGYALFPAMSVRRNVGYGLKVARVPKDEARRRVDEMLELTGLAGLDRRYPHELSGGEQQRVALARALAAGPKALLLDEPLSALDERIRSRLREDFRSLQRSLGITALYVTHDQEEAFSISDRVAVMSGGRIEQVGSPAEIYDEPATPFVASFIGDANFLKVRVLDPAHGSLGFGEGELRCAYPLRSPHGSEARLAVRPEAIRASTRPPGEGAGPNVVEGRLRGHRLLGSLRRLEVEAGGSTILVDELNDPRSPLLEPGSKLWLSFDPASCRLLE
jgi:putative spermidine/putrescine transport system ATP-binding protein